MPESFTAYAREKLREIHGLSSEYNSRTDDHAAVLLDFVGKHADELKRLYEAKDPHFDVETGDLIVLCCELLLERGKDPDRIMDRCYGRFSGKLKELIVSRKERG